MEYQIKQPVAPLSARRVTLELDGEELTLLAALVYQNLTGSHPAHTRAERVLVAFEDLTGVSILDLSSRGNNVTTDVLSVVEREMGAA